MFPPAPVSTEEGANKFPKFEFKRGVCVASLSLDQLVAVLYFPNVSL